MEPARSYRVRERPLDASDYDVPIGWWGWNWEPPVPLSITQLLAARDLDARTAALVWLVLEAHGSLLIAAEQPHAGKTTMLTAFLDLLPREVRRVYLRGWAETFDFLRFAEPRRTLLLANELSSHLPVYLWGEKAVRAFATLPRGYALASTLHADSADEAVQQIVGELGVDPADLARVDLLMVMRMDHAGPAYAGAGPSGHVAPPVRRTVSLHRLTLEGGAVRALPLVEWDRRRDTHEHDTSAELELLCARLQRPFEELRAQIDARAAYLEELGRAGVLSIPAIRAAVAERRGAGAPRFSGGDPAV